MLDNVTLLFVVESQPSESKQKSYSTQFCQQFASVIGIVNEEADDRWISPRFVDRVTFSADEGKVTGLNRAMPKVQSGAAMILESDEVCLSSQLPEVVRKGTCYRSIIDVPANDDPQRNYQIRIFPSPGNVEHLFDGRSIPDLSQSFYDRNWDMAEQVIPIHKTEMLISNSHAQLEADTQSNSVMSQFWEAILDSDEQRYRKAVEGFRAVLKNNKLFEFDRLAALNGLANALVEQHKLDEAVSTARRSLDINSRQRAPYLTLYKVFDLKGEPQQAYDFLCYYLEVRRYASRANLDVSLPLEECHYLMADTTFKQGDYERAFEHYEWFYALNNGDVSQKILEKLFIYAIELENYEQSVHYFNDIFGEYMPDNLDDDMSARLLESLSLFMDNGWYDFVCGIYEQLVNHNPEDNELLNGWITTLLKNKQIDKAQELIEQRKAS